MTYQTIETELTDGLLVLRHARPDKLNARNSQMYVEIMAALKGAADDDEVVAVVLTGKGRFFCSGMDFQSDPGVAYELLPTDGAGVRSVKQNLPTRLGDDVGTWLPVQFIDTFINFDKPLIGAANGPAIGEGFTSLLHCDLVYAAESAYFWAPFARAGVAPEFCSTLLLEQRLGRSLASACMYFGRRISAADARSAGFVVDIVAEGEGFEADVISRLQAGLDLAGPPELRGRTLRGFKRLAYPETQRERLAAQNRAEFQLIRERQLSGETEAVQAYNRKDLPQ